MELSIPWYVDSGSLQVYAVWQRLRQQLWHHPVSLICILRTRQIVGRLDKKKAGQCGRCSRDVYIECDVISLSSQNEDVVQHKRRFQKQARGTRRGTLHTQTLA
jgi:hypothetical protein